MSATTKRFLRRGLLAALVVLLAIAVVLRLPAVQLKLARAVLPDGLVALDYVSAGPGGAVVRNLRVTTPSATVTVERAAVDVAFWSSLLHLALDVESATLSGVDVRTAPAAGASPAEPPVPRPPFAGLRDSARLPKWLRVREAGAEGRVHVTTASGLLLDGPWDVALRDLAAGSAAVARVNASLDAQRGNELVASTVVAVDASADVRADSQITRLAVDAAAHPAGDDLGLRAALAAQLDERAESYTFDATGRTGARLLHADAQLDADGKLAGRWEANVTPGVVAAFARGRSVADLSGTSTGEIRLDLRNRTAEVRSATHAQGAGWEAFDARLAALGTLDFDAEVDASAVPGTVTASGVSLGVRSAARGELLTLRTLQPLRFSTDTWLVEPDQLGEPALRLALNDLPLHWLASAFPAAGIEDGQVNGAIDVVRDQERTTVLVTVPIAARGVQLAPVAGRAIPAFNLTLTPHATLGGGALEAAIEELKLETVTGGVIAFHGKAATSRDAWPVASFEGDVDARLPALAKIVPQIARVHGATRLTLDFETLVLGLASAQLGAASRDGRELLGADLAGERPLEVTLPDLAIDWDAFDPQSFALRLDRFPLAWLSPFIPEIDFATGDVSGRFTAVARRGEGVRLETNAPLVIANLLPVYRDRPAAQPLRVTLRPELRLAKAGSSVALRSLHLETPNGNSLDGEIVVDAPADRDRLDVTVALDGNLAPFARRFGAELGKMSFRQTAELEPATGRLAVKNLDVTFTDPGGATFFELAALRPFFVTGEPLTVGVDTGSRRILHATVKPLKLEGLLPNIFGFDLTGVLPEGEFFGTAEADGSLTIAAEMPLTFRDVSVRWQNATLLDRVTMSTQYEVTYAADGIRARSVDLRALAPDGREVLHTRSELVAPLRGDRLLDSAKIDIQADLERLAAQPVLASLPPFTGGRLEASIDFENTGEANLAFGARVQSAATAAGGPLPDLDVKLDANGVRGQRLRLVSPVRLQSPAGTSDLTLDGRIDSKKDGTLGFDATLSGSRVVVADVDRWLEVLAPRNETPSAPAAPTADRATVIAQLRARRDTVPAWTDRLSGAARVNVGAFVFPSMSLEGLHGTLALTPKRAELRDVRASLLDAKLQAHAAIDFDAARPKPYTLDFRAGVTGLDLASLFKAIAPNAAPTAEGRFELESTLAGSGLNPLDLGLSSLGEIRLAGTNGVFRGLAAEAGTGSKAARVIGILTFSKELKAIGRLLDGIGEIHFSQASLRLDRAELHRIDLSEFSIVAPQLRVNATGNLEVGPQQPLLASPLKLSTQIAARGDVAIVFDGMGLLVKQPDSVGYRELTRPVDIGGTAAAPDATAFWDLLDEGAQNARGSFGVGLRALNSRLEAAGAH